MSGDDKFMTRWVVKEGWKMRMQLSPECTLATTFKADGKFFKQILRWTRNTWRSDFKSLVLERTIWRRYPIQARPRTPLPAVRGHTHAHASALCLTPGFQTTRRASDADGGPHGDEVDRSGTCRRC